MAIAQHSSASATPARGAGIPTLWARLARVAVAGLACAMLFGADRVVSPKGNDNAAGTLESPWRTLARATRDLQPGDTCWLRGGVYREMVVPAASGQAGKPIAFRAWRNEVAVISGADPIEGWSRADHPSGKVWKAAMPWTMNDGKTRVAGSDQLFVDGRMVPEARWPNLPPKADPARSWRETWARSTQGALTKPGTTRYTVSAASQYTAIGLGALPEGALTGASLTYLPGFLWAPMSGRIDGHSGDQISFIHEWNDASEPYQCRANDFLVVYGSPGLIDAEGEWARLESGTVLLWTPDGKEPARGQVEAKRRVVAFDLRGRQHITISGLAIRAAGIISNDQSAGIVLENVEGRYLDHSMWIPRWWGTPADGIRLDGPDSLVRGCDFRYCAGSLLRVTGANSRVVDNVLVDAGYTYGGNLHASGPAMLVERNTIRDCGGQNALDIRHSAGSMVRFNDVSGSARLLIDGGAVMITRDFDGKGTEVCHNYIHDTVGLSDGKQSYYGSSGIYLEGGVKNYKLHHNLIRNVTGAAICMPDDRYENIIVAHNTSVGGIAVLRGTGQSTVLANLMRFEGTHPPGNVAWADGLVVDAANGDFRPRANATAVVGKAVPVPGLAEAIPDVGAIAANGPLPAYGACLTPGHAREITVTWSGTPSASTTYVLGDLPPDRRPGADFQLKVGSNEAGGKVFRDQQGRWVVRGVPVDRKQRAGAIQVVIDGIVVPAGNPPDQVEADAKTTPRAAAVTRKPVSPKGGAAALERYRALLVERCAARCAARRQPRFLFKRLRQQVVVESASESSLDLRQSAPGGGVVSLPFAQLDGEDLAALAVALTEGGETVDHALAAFFLLAEGYEEDGRSHLLKAAAEADAVQIEFPEPPAAR